MLRHHLWTIIPTLPRHITTKVSVAGPLKLYQIVEIHRYFSSHIIIHMASVKVQYADKPL